MGSKYSGRVRNMTNFGAFVEMEEGIDGLIHISDLSWTKKIKHPSEVLKKGDEVEVVVLDVNKKDRRVSLGFKQLTEDPWPAYADKYKVDTMVQAKVVRFVDKGLVVELDDELEGFVPLSQLSESNMAKAQGSLKEGEEVELMVIEFDRENKRIVLSQKRPHEREKASAESSEKDDIKAYMETSSAPETLGEMIKEKMAEAAEAAEAAETEAKPKKATKAKAKKADAEEAPAEEAKPKKATKAKAKKADAEEAPAEED